ncbi:hypothetical protein ACFSQQ_00130 [Mesorhizobium kowhaii]|uniref:hypothetical protein n=1 Tax=Mesorhizobium kowhaii TaxID=1300272 RepID=UPI0035E947B7
MVGFVFPYWVLPIKIMPLEDRRCDGPVTIISSAIGPSSGGRDLSHATSFFGFRRAISNSASSTGHFLGPCDESPQEARQLQEASTDRTRSNNRTVQIIVLRQPFGGAQGRLEFCQLRMARQLRRSRHRAPTNMQSFQVR